MFGPLRKAFMLYVADVLLLLLFVLLLLLLLLLLREFDFKDVPPCATELRGSLSGTFHEKRSENVFFYDDVDKKCKKNLYIERNRIKNVVKSATMCHKALWHIKWRIQWHIYENKSGIDFFSTSVDRECQK